MKKHQTRSDSKIVPASRTADDRQVSREDVPAAVEPLEPVSLCHMIKIAIGLVTQGHFEYISNMFISPLARDLVSNATQVGLIQVFNPLFGVLVQPIIGWRGDHTWTKLGRRKPYLLFAIPWILTSLLVMPLTHSLLVFVGAVIIYQFFVDMYVVSSGTMMPETVPLEQRSRQQAMSVTVGSFVTVCAIWFVGRHYDKNHLYPFVLAAGIAVLSTAMLLFGIKEYYHGLKKRPPLYVAPVHVAKAALSNRNIIIMFLVLLFSSYGNYSVLMFWPLFMRDTLGGTIGGAVEISIVTHVFMMMLALPFGVIADRFSKKNVMIFGQIVGIMALLAGLLAQAVWHMYFQLILVAIAQTAFLVTFYPLLTQFMPRDRIGTITGATPIVFSGARVLAGLTAGRVIDAFGENYRVSWAVALACAIPTFFFILMVDPAYRANQDKAAWAE